MQYKNQIIEYNKNYIFYLKDHNGYNLYKNVDITNINILCEKIILNVRKTKIQSNVRGKIENNCINIFLHIKNDIDEKTFFINVSSVIIHEYVHYLRIKKLNKKINLINKFNHEEFIALSHQFYYESIIRNVNKYKILNKYLNQFNNYHKKIYFKYIKNIWNSDSFNFLL